MLQNALIRVYGIESRYLRSAIRKIIYRTEGGDIYSETLRKIFSIYHKVTIGMYSHGGCFDVGAMDCNTTIGRYCSIAHGARVLNVNHRLDFKSTHAFFFNSDLGYCEGGLMKYTSINIGSDVWLGANSLILPHVKQIGHGAVVAAGAVVNKDVPPYAVVVGNPARIVRFRFPSDKIKKLLDDPWWVQPIENLKIDEFTRPFLLGASPLQADDDI